MKLNALQGMKTWKRQGRFQRNISAGACQTSGRRPKQAKVAKVSSIALKLASDGSVGTDQPQIHL